jgi:outer membrane protein assembly factor BamB
LSITGTLSAWDTGSGERLWSRDYGTRFKKSHPYWGVSTSPLVDGDRVVVHFGTDDRGALIALDTESGDEVWSHGNDGASYASPILVEIQGKRQVVELSMKGLVSVDAESGRLLWKYAYPQLETDQNMVTPVYHEGLVLQGGENRGIQCLRPREEHGNWTVEQQWHQEQVALDMSSAVVNGDLLYGFSHYDSGRLFCLDIKTGEVLWQGPGRTGSNVMFLAIPGYVVALIDDGQLQIIAARGDRYEKTASYRVSDGDTWAPPVLFDGAVLTKDLQTLSLWSIPY